MTRELTTAELERFWSKVDQSGDCWIWMAARSGGDRGGYGQFALDGKALYAHRVSYELSVSAIPPGFELDHRCRNHSCVRPDHLEAVTRQVNQLRGQTLAARSATKTHCPAGHPYDLLNTHIKRDGSRSCRACHRTRERARQRRLRVA